MLSLFFVFVYFYVVLEKYYKPITVQYSLADRVLWVNFGLTLGSLCWT